MKKIITLTILVVATMNGFGQIKPVELFSTKNYSTIEIPKYKDTLNCLVRAIDTLGYTDKWVKAKVVFKGGLHNPTMRTTWSIPYAGVAVGPFNNEIIFEKPIQNSVVIQI